MPPNIGLDIMPDSMDVFQILPLGAERCQMRYPIFVRPGEPREVRLQRYLATRIMRGTTKEDRTLCENVQRGIGSHGCEFGPLSSYEHCILDFHRRVTEGCPVASLPSAPKTGTLRQANDEMRRLL
jgi:choline monooxygenase